METIAEFAGLDIAVILPCFNEGQTIAEVVRGFQAALPGARIYVFDNSSTDITAIEAAKAGAEVYREPRRGKGNVVRRMFADIDADIYVMADGDGTYDPTDAPELVRALICERVDMAVGTRTGVEDDAGRAGHAFGNRLFNRLYGRLFGTEFSDIFSGYRAFTRRFVKSFPAISTGFEIETEMSVHATQLKIPTVEIPLTYGRRPDGSHSKLHTFRDGAKILWTFALLAKETRPLAFFGVLAAVLMVASIAISYPLLVTYLDTGLVPRFPTAILATGMMLTGFLLGMCGVILDSLSRSRREHKRLAYVSMPALRCQ